MMVHEKTQMLFIEVPKTGSTAMAKFLGTKGWKQATWPGMVPGRHAPLAARPPRGWMSFGVVRNPWDRMASLWRASGRSHTNPFWTYLQSGRFKIAGVDVFHYQQTSWLRHVECVMRYEHLTSARALCSESYGFPLGDLPVVNRSPRRTEPEWTQREIDLVADRFACDVERWGYTGPGCTGPGDHIDVRGGVPAVTPSEDI